MLSPQAWGYYSSGADGERTMRETRSAFEAIKLKARAFAKANSFSGLQTTILGHAVSSPICIAPTAMQRMGHPDGELATARAAIKNGVAYGFSGWATTSYEELQEGAPGGVKIGQFYATKSHEMNKDIFERMEKAGFVGIAVTCDTQILGKREADERTGFSLPPHLSMRNLDKYIPADEMHGKGGSQGSQLARYVREHKDNDFSWEKLRDLKKMTKLAVIVKGVQCAEDARLAVEHGADAIWVSNHGARQLDTTPASIEVLEECV